MAKKALPLLTGGLNEKTRPDLIKDDQLQVCTNYEINGDGFLYRRKAASEYDSELTTAIGGVFDSVSFVSEPYYPQTRIKVADIEMDSDFILFIFGTTSSGAYELHAFFKKEGSWTNVVNSDDNTLSDLLTDGDINYDSDSDVQIAVAQDSVFIADGVNNTHMVSIDTDGNMKAGVSGIPAPTNKARVTEMTDWQPELWENTENATYLSTPGLFQCVYTVVTKTGEESNPSPLSDTLDMQFFKLDADSVDERWIEKIGIKDLAVPDVPDNILEQLESFRVYMRVIRYSEGGDAKTLEFTEDFKITVKNNDDGSTLHYGTNTGNEYTVTVFPEAGNVASYENDVAPVAKTVDQLGGITMVGNVKIKKTFPHEFKYNIPITLNNTDSKGYVDAVIKIRLWDKYADEGIDNFTVNNFVLPSGLLQNEEHIRLYDEDLTTPIMVAYNGYNDSDDFVVDDEVADSYVDLYIKIPYLKPASPHTIYLVWTPADAIGSYDGVPSHYNDLITDTGHTWDGNLGIHYGRFMIVGNHGWSRQQVWNGLKVLENDMASSKISIGEVYGRNRAQNNDTLISPASFVTSLSNGITWGESSVEYVPISGEYISDTYSGECVAGGDPNASWISLGWDTIPMPETGYIYFSYKFKIREYYLTTLATLLMTESDGSVVEDEAVAKIDVVDIGGNTHEYEISILWNNEYVYDTGIDIGGSVGTVGTSHEFKLLLSWSKRKYCVAVLKKDGTVETFSKSYDEDMIQSGKYLSGVQFGAYNNISLSPFGSFIGNYNVKKNIFLDVDNSNDLDAVKNIFNYMPGFDNMIGYEYSTSLTNRRVSFGDTKEIVLKTQENMVKWTDVNYTSFPDLFFKQVKEPVKKVMAAPSFLQFQYQNTFIIFTRNSINRFVLEGSASGWSGSSSSLIEEKTQYGLLADKSLVRAGDALFWLSEVGVVMWNKDGMNLISKNIVDVPIDENSVMAVGFYSPLNNQYILYVSDSDSYVYHIERNAWTKYTGLDVISASTLTGGSQVDNVNLLLDSDGTINKYPAGDYTSEESEIKTKDLFFEKGVLRKMKADFESDVDTDVDMISIMTKNDLSGNEITKTNTITNPNPNHWRGISLANSRGKEVSFKITNANIIKSIMYDLRVEE